MLVGSMGSIMLGAIAIKTQTSTPRLRDPFDPKRPRKIVPPHVSFSACPSSMPIVRSLKGVRYYTDSASTIIDENLRKANIAENKPLVDFVETVEMTAAAWLSAQGEDQKPAECGLGLLRQWAAGSAMLGRFNAQGQGSQRWNATGLAIAYLALRHALPDRHDPVIGAWFLRLGEVCRDQGAGLRNNHFNWTAAAIAASAVAANSRELWAWGIAATRRCINEIRQDGSLPLELSRGPKALNYHSFAVAPLFLVAELARANGVDLYSYGDGAIGRLARFTLRNLDAPGEIAKLAGVKQDKHTPLHWIEIWARRGGGVEAERLAARRRTVIDSYMGGNQTLLFGG